MAAQNKAYRRSYPILAIGDSITANGYWRDYLRESLLALGVEPEWIGTQRSGHFQGDLHEAYSGISLATMRGNFPALAATYTTAPRLVVLFLGANDAAGGGANYEADLNGILDDAGCIYALWPGVSVAVCQVLDQWAAALPHDPISVAGIAVIKAAQAKVVGERQAAAKDISLAATAISEYADTSDGVHPTQATHQTKIAPAILAGLAALPRGMP